MTRDMISNYQNLDKLSLERLLTSTKEKFENYTSLKKPYEEINEVYVLLKKLQAEMNRRLTGRFGY